MEVTAEAQVVQVALVVAELAQQMQIAEVPLQQILAVAVVALVTKVQITAEPSVALAAQVSSSFATRQPTQLVSR